MLRIVIPKLLSVVTIVGAAFAVLFFLILVLRRDPKFASIVSWVAGNVLVISLVIACLATLGSLTLSSVLGYEPCELCWMQRIFLFSQILLLGIALLKKDRRISDYVLGLSVLGMLVAAYQYYLQLGGFSLFACSADVASSCARVYIREFGFVTIPFMSFVAFALLALVNLTTKLERRKNKNPKDDEVLPDS